MLGVRLVNILLGEMFGESVWIVVQVHFQNQNGIGSMLRFVQSVQQGPMQWGWQTLAAPRAHLEALPTKAVRSAKRVLQGHTRVTNDAWNAKMGRTLPPQACLRVQRAPLGQVLLTV